jgi:hypothetical protein
MFLRSAQREGQGVHAALLCRSEFSRQGGVYSSGPVDPPEAIEGGAYQEDAVVGLAADRRAGVASMTSTVVLDFQNDRRERLGKGFTDSVGAGLDVCHGGRVGP